MQNEGFRKKIKTAWTLPNNNLFIVALLSTIIFLLVEVTLRIYDLYRTAPWVDIPSHFTAGAALGIIFLWIVSLSGAKHKKSAVLFFVLAAGLLWEVMEILQEMVFYNPPYLKDYFFWDGFFDVIVNILGAALTIFIIYVIKEKNHFLKGIDI